jgi:predicted kinase
MLVIVCGLQGTGKTTVAKRIAVKLNATLLRTDTLRRELVQIPQYTDKEKEHIYDEMFIRAHSLLGRHGNIVLDATFSMLAHRNKARELAQGCRTQFKIVAVMAPGQIVRTRFEHRLGDDSEASYQEYLITRDLFEQITEDHIEINNSGTLDDLDMQIAVHF